MTLPLTFEVYKPKERLLEGDTYHSKPEIAATMVRQLKTTGLKFKLVPADDSLSAGESSRQCPCNPQALAAQRHHRSQRTTAEIAQALAGDYRREHVFVLWQELQLYDIYQAQIAACDHQIKQCLTELSDRVDIAKAPSPQPKHVRHKPQGNEPAFDPRTYLYRISGVDFTQTDGLGVLTVQTILSDFG